MKQIITAKLKLELSPQQKQLLREITLRFRDALNYTSQVAFASNKMSSGVALQKKVYKHIRTVYQLPSQMACNIPRQVGNTYKGLLTKVEQNNIHRQKGYTKRRYKGLDKPPLFASRTCTLNYKRDYSFVKGKVSLITLQGRIKVNYSGYDWHLELIRSGIAKIGAGKIWYDQRKKNYYLLVSLTIPIPELEPRELKKVVGVDVGQRYLAVSTDTQHKTQFFSGKKPRQKSSDYQRVRKRLQQKGTRSAKRRLKAIAGRERRFTADVNHKIAAQIVTPNTLIGLENLTHIRERTKPRRTGKKASVKQRKALQKPSQMVFCSVA